MILVCGKALFDVFLDEDRGASLQLDARPAGSPFLKHVGVRAFPRSARPVRTAVARPSG
jgi:hypothetical protein